MLLDVCTGIFWKIIVFYTFLCSFPDKVVGLSPEGKQDILYMLHLREEKTEAQDVLGICLGHIV